MWIWIVLASLFELAKAAEEGHIEPVVAVLYPWFTQAIGIIAFFLLARYAHMLPYTAVMFLIGTLMGIGLKLANLTDQLTESLEVWHQIDGELLLVVFLPGLLFKDAFCSNVHLMFLAFNQILVMALYVVTSYLLAGRVAPCTHTVFFV